VYDHPVGDPYRDAPVRALVVQSPQPQRTMGWTALLAAAGAGIALIGGAAADTAFGVAVTIGIFGYGVVTLLRGRGARRRVAALPFPVEIVGDAGSDSPRPIRDVEIWFTEPVRGPDADAVTAAWLTAGLFVRVDGACFRLERWSWGDQDVTQLATLLDGLGRDQHARHPIARVVVHCGNPPTPLF
jgi:hypothetical protein